MTLSNRSLRFFAAILLAGFSIFAVHAHSHAGQRETAHAAIITVTPENSKPALEDFSWLAGRWEGKLGPMTAEQQWMAPKNGTMQASSASPTPRKPSSSSFSPFAKTPGGIEFYFRHFSPELKPWEEKEAYHLNLTKAEGGVFRFDNPVVNQVKDAILTRVDGDIYISHGDITDADGKPKAIEVTYHRVK